MKKILLFMVLGLALFAAACSSATDNAFLDKVKDKSVVEDGTTIGTFSSDGNTYTDYSSLEYIFDSAESENKATYTWSDDILVFEISGTSVVLSGGKTTDSLIELHEGTLE